MTNNKIDRRQVKMGPRKDDLWLVTEGLQAGERIVYEGLQAVRDGVVVNPQTHKIE